MYNFTGSDSIPLPTSLGIQDRIPGIAFKIPDLEGVAQLILTEVGTGNVKACVQATLSNGWSTHQTSVEWVTRGIALVTLLLAIWHSLSPQAILPFRFIDLLLLYQTIASSSFLSLNYPSTYRAFTLNFAWAMGLFSTSSSFQPSIDRMRHLTGGNLANATSASAVGLVNRKLSPYNLIDSAPTQASSSLTRRAASSWSRLLIADFPTSIRSTLASATEGTVQTVTTSSSNVLQAGIPISVNSLHIGTANAFMTVFLCALILVACTLAVFLLAFILSVAVGRFSRQDDIGKTRLKSAYLTFVHAWSIRLALFLFLPIVLFSFYQWTLKDSWLSILLSVIAFIALLIAVLYPAVVILRYARREGREALFKDSDHLASNGPLYGQYRVHRFYFFIPLLLAVFLKAIFIAFATGNGEVQIILMVILEGFVVISHLVLRPYRTRGGDVFSSFLAIIRLICSGLMIAFIESLNVAPIPRTVIGLVIAVVFSVTVLITYINLIINSGIHWLWTRGRSKASIQSSTDVSIVETSDDGSVEKSRMLLSPSSSSKNVLRPANPTPEHNDNLSPPLLQPFPVSPTETEITTTSAYTNNRTSGTMTVGSLLPRRWSFSPLNSPTVSPQMQEPGAFASHNNNSPSYRYSDTPSLQNGHEPT
ncbi:hypothetical protein C0991_011173 [Blastosporella zonata]|nr:hypothetical protein C0991_011173 [Blastosporella zonata]